MCAGGGRAEAMGELWKGKLKHLFRAGNLRKISRSRQGLEDSTGGPRERERTWSERPGPLEPHKPLLGASQYPPCLVELVRGILLAVLLNSAPGVLKARKPRGREIHQGETHLCEQLIF